MAIRQIAVPDIGNFKDVSVIEVMVKAGDTISVTQGSVDLLGLAMQAFSSGAAKPAENCEPDPSSGDGQ